MIDVKVYAVNLEEFFAKCKQITPLIREAVFQGMMDGGQKIVDQTRQNIIATARPGRKGSSGRLSASVEILGWEQSGNIVSVTVGSNIPGYPFFQEYGYSAKGPKGKRTNVRGRFFLNHAAMSVVPSIPGIIEQRFNAMAGGMK